MNPSRPIHRDRPSHVITHKGLSHLGGGHTRNNLNGAYRRASGLRYSTGVNNRLYGFRNRYFSTHQNYLQRRFGVCGGFYRNDVYRYHYSRWFNHGFCGGYYYPVYPWYNIHNYFVYPMINWLYVQTVDTEYYQTWYGTDYNVCPVTAFPYATAFFPTQQMRDLGMEMSGLNATLQCGFRSAMVIMTKSLVQLVANQIAASFVLADSDIVVNHYENLGNTGVVLEGFINHDDINLPFKAVLDLVTPSNTSVFIPTSDEPIQTDIDQLDRLNNQVKNLGGDPSQVNDEPENLVTPPPAF